MARRAKKLLTEIKPYEVSIVDTAASGETFFVVKRAVVEEEKEEIDMPENQSVSKGWVDGEYKVSPEDVASGISRHATWMIDEAIWLKLPAEEFAAKVNEVVSYLVSVGVEVVDASESGETVQKSSETRESVVKSCGEKLANSARDILASRKMPKDDIIGVVKALRGLIRTETKDESSPSLVDVEKKGEEGVKVLIEGIERLIEISKGLQKAPTPEVSLPGVTDKKSRKQNFKSDMNINIANPLILPRKSSAITIDVLYLAL